MNLVERYLCVDCESRWEELSGTTDLHCLQCGSTNFAKFNEGHCGGGGCGGGCGTGCDTCDAKDTCVTRKNKQKQLTSA